MKAVAKFYAKLKPGERRILAVTVLFIGFAFVDRVIVMPITSTLATLNQSVKEQESSIRKSMNMLLHKEAIIATSNEYSSYSVKARNSEEEMVDLLREVESVAGKAGVSLLYVKPGTIKDDPGSKKFYANMECEGGMEQVATFFHDIESSSQLIKIEKYAIQPKSKGSSSAKATVSVYKTVLV